MHVHCTTPNANCAVCGKGFHTYPGSGARGPARFCSKTCSGIAHRVPIDIRFWAKVHKDGPVPPHAPQLGKCWLWTGSIVKGYGIIRGDDRGSVRRASHVSWELHNGPIPDGLFVLHRCDNSRCIRPDHLFLGTKKANWADMVSKGRNCVLRGEQCHSAKLTAAQVINIRTRAAEGCRKAELARQFGVGWGTIDRIVRRVKWKHV